MSPTWKKFDVLVIGFVFLILFCVTNYGYFHYFYGGDGFNCFQWLRNVIHGYGNYEGPTYEYVMANHSYFTVLLLAPLVALFPSPVVLNDLCFLNIFVSTVLFYFIARSLIREERFQPILLALVLAYVFHPITLDGLCGFMWSIFQPESVLPALIMILAGAFLRAKRSVFFLTAAFILLTKEEYIPVSLVLYGWLLGVLYLMKSRISSVRKMDYLVLALIFSACSALSIFALLHYKTMSPHIIVNRNASLKTILNWSDLWSGRFLDLGLIVTFFYTSLSAMGLALIFLFHRQWKALLFLLGSLSVFVLGRLAADRLIYGAHMHPLSHLSPGLDWANWARIIIPPMIALSCVFALRISDRSRLSKLSLRFATAWLLACVVLLNIHTPPTVFEIARGHRMFPLPGGASDIEQRTLISGFFKGENSQTLVIIPNYDWEYFASAITFAQYGADTLQTVKDTSSAPFFQRWKSEAKYVVLRKDRVDAGILESFAEFDRIAETDSYILLRRSRSAAPALEVHARYW